MLAFSRFPGSLINSDISLKFRHLLNKQGYPPSPTREDDLVVEAKRGFNRVWRILLHPGSGDKDKNHPPGFWLKLLEGLRQSLTPIF
jgi:hypothetical protein